MNNFYNRLLGVVILALNLLTALHVYADGSKDLYPSGIAGNRAFLRSSTSVTVNWPFPNTGTHYVYAKVGETITLASSAIESSGNTKRIYLYGVDGNEITLTNGSGRGHIASRTTELAGPLRPGEAANGNKYTPIYYTVQQEGIYRIEFYPQGAIAGNGTNGNTGSADGNWTQPGTNSNYIAAWDVSVVNTANTGFVKGRVYTNMLNMSIGSSTTTGFYGLVYVLTKDGYTYRVDNNGNNGIFFTFFVNNNGFVNASTQAPIYKSLNTTSNLGGLVHNPNNADQGTHITHKLFYTLPSTDLPKTAPGAVPGGNTWVKSPPIEPNVSGVQIKGLDGTVGQVSNKGGNIEFIADVQGNYIIEIQSTGSPFFPTRTMTGSAVTGLNRIYWDGKDGNGVQLPAGQVPAQITVQLQGAEVHFPFFDMEFNIQGTIIELLNHNNLNNVVSDIVYWNDDDVSNASRGSNSTPKNNSHLPPTNSTGISSRTNGHKWGDGTNETSNTFGDNKSIDTWTFIKGEAVTINSLVVVKVADLKISSITTDKDPIRLGDDLTYTVKVKNDGPSDVVGAPFTFILPPGFDATGTPVFSGNSCGSESIPIIFDSATGRYVSSLNLPNGCEITYTFKAIVTSSATPGSKNAIATILRPNDVTDPDATNTSDPGDPANYLPPTDPFYECENNGLGTPCNNIMNKMVVLIRQSDLEIEKTVDQSTPEIGDIITFTLKVTNHGPHEATNIVITDLLPSGYTAGTINNGGVLTGNTITWNISSLAKDDEISVSYEVEVLATGNYSNTANVTGDGEDPDPNNNEDTETTTPLVNSTNAVDDINVTYKDMQVTGNVLTNDFDIEGNTQAVNPVPISGPSNGTLTLNVDGTYTYIPANGFVGTDSFIYEVCDNGTPQACDRAKVTIKVIERPNPSKNNNIVANDDTGITEEGTPVTGNVLVNDFDPDGDNLIINTTPVTDPSNGTVTINSDGTYEYIPNPGFKGKDTFTYEVCDDGDPKTCDRATVTITVLPKDSKANYTFANDDVYYGEGKKTISGNILDNDTDPEGNTQTVNSTPVSGPSNGTLSLNADGTFTYVANNGFVGTDSFIYEVCDNGTPQACDRATVYIVVNMRNYWHGTIDNDWAKTDNWTANFVPASGEDIEFATNTNNGIKGDGNGLGTAVRDLHLDTDRVIGDLINNSDMNLLVTVGNELVINGVVKDNNPNNGTIIVKADPDKPTGTLLFTNPAANTSVNATVEFINKAYECATCGFYKKQWQYFGIPVNSSSFPYLTPKVEIVNQWVEPFNGNKWRPAPYAPDTELKAFKGYEITNSSNIQPTHVYSFSGVLNVGNVNLPVTKTSGVNYYGMNLLANSFTGAIPITSGAISLGSVELKENTVYLFNMGTRDQWRKLNGGSISGIAAGQYQSVPFNLAGQAGIPDRILSMHTFMLDVTTPGDITLKYDQLVKNELNLSTTKPWKSAMVESNATQLPYIVMDIISNTSADRVWLFENARTTASFDNGWDAYKLQEEGLMQVYVSDEANSKYQIATVPEFIGTTFGVKAGADENYTINLSVIPEVENRKLYLHDLYTGHSYPVVNNAEYIISSSPIKAQERFKLSSSSTGLIDEQQTVPIDIAIVNNIITVDNRSDENCTAMIYDMSGRLVAKKNIYKNSVEYIEESARFVKGIYIVKVTGEVKIINKVERILIK